MARFVIAPAPELTPAEHGVLGEEMAHLVRHNELMETLHQEEGQGRGVQEEEKVPSQHAQNLKQGHIKSGSQHRLIIIILIFNII